MKTFQQFLVEQQEDQQAQELKNEIKKLSQPQSVQLSLKLLNLPDDATIEDLIKKLENNTKVKQVFAKYELIKAKQSVQEGVIGDIFGGIGKALVGVVKWAINSITKTIGHVFKGAIVGGARMTSRLHYASLLLLTFGLAPILLAAGAPVVGFPMAWTGTWWGLLWFGKNFLEPVLLNVRS